MRNTILILVAAGAVAACSGPEEPVHTGSAYGVDINRDGTNVFGTAGSGLTDAQIQEAINARTVCNDAKQVRNLAITRSASGTTTFTGVCA